MYIIFLKSFWEIDNSIYKKKQQKEEKKLILLSVLVLEGSLTKKLKFF